MDVSRGSLAHYRLQLLVPALFEGSPPWTGVLRLERGPVQRSFHIERGLLRREASSRPAEHLAQVLADLSILDANTSAAAFEASESQGVWLGQYLLDHKLVELPRLLEALEYKARESFFDCYEWESGEFEFTPGPPEDRGGVQLELKLASLHRDALSRRREWSAFWEVFHTAEASLLVDRSRLGHGGEEHSAEQAELLARAEAHARLGELLLSSREGRIQAARRILRLYRRGVLSPRSGHGSVVRDGSGVAQLLGVAQGLFASGDFESAAALASQALERAAVPEAHHLFREAEQRATEAARADLDAWEGRLRVADLPRPHPSTLTADELYLHSRLKSAPSVRALVHSAAMGPLAACRSIKKLLGVGALAVEPMTA